MIIYKGNGNSNFVPWTCNTKILLAILIGLSFLNIYNSSCTQKAELASTRRIISFTLFYWTGIWSTFILTPSLSGLSISRPIILTSNEKFIFEQFLKGIFIIPLLGILIIFTPDFLSYNSFKQIICGTSPLLWIGIIKGVRSSIWSSNKPLISVDI